MTTPGEPKGTDMEERDIEKARQCWRKMNTGKFQDDHEFYSVFAAALRQEREAVMAEAEKLAEVLRQFEIWDNHAQNGGRDPYQLLDLKVIALANMKEVLEQFGKFKEQYRG